ncbi:MAG: hypothetical protein KAR11_01160 [Phycisphaerae bacterium]|nr:hypothetical protein [Phycisphaerae bacterium]
MRQTVTLLVLMIASLGMFGCSQTKEQTKEDVAAEAICLLEEEVKILASIKDKFSAETARPKLVKNHKRLKILQGEIDALCETKEARDKLMGGEKFNDRFCTAMGNCYRQGNRIRDLKNSEIWKALGDEVCQRSYLKR